MVPVFAIFPPKIYPARQRGIFYFGKILGGQSFLHLLYGIRNKVGDQSKKDEDFISRKVSCCIASIRKGVRHQGCLHDTNAWKQSVNTTN